MRNPNGGIRQYIVYTVIALPFLLLCYAATQVSVDIPYWDQWDLAKQHIIIGKVTFSNLWMNWNQHRIFFPKIIMVTLAHFSHWNIYWEITCNFILGALGFFVIYQQVRAVEQETSRPFSLLSWFSLSVLFFSFMQSENWFWGFQLQIFLENLAVMAGFAMLVRWQQTLSIHYFITALLCGIVASYSFATGLAFWPVGGLLVLINCSKSGKSYFYYWCATTLATIALYFYQYVTVPDFSIPGPHGLFYILHHPFLYLQYAAVYIGASFAFHKQTIGLMAGLIGFGMVLQYLCLWQKTDRQNKPQSLHFFYLLIFYAAIGSLITGIGRTELGIDQALSSRYTTISLTFWIAALVIVSVKASFSPKKTLPGTVIFILVMAVLNDTATWKGVAAHASELNITRNYILTGRSDLDDTMLKHVSPEPVYVRSVIPYLKEHKLSLFRNP